MSKRIASIGDIHACHIELEELYNALCWQSLDEIWHLGDTCDRGLDSHKTIQFLIQKGIKGVLGNHDQSIINHWETYCKTGNLPRNIDKKITIQQVTQQDIEYLKTLPKLHVFDDLGLILVHGGIWPGIPLWEQPENVIRAQMILPYIPGPTRWFGVDFKGNTEEQSYNEGYRRWYHVYDHKEDIIFGHTSFNQPMIYQSKAAGKCIGIDTGSSFGGSLTACVYNSNQQYYFVSIKNKKVYYKHTTRSFWEAN